jgi:UTP--glucose-1-phosphate uridylyltransferase
VGRAVTKAVIPAAGLGTRFLPATKAVPKELIPVVDVPSIQYVVQEAVQAGLDDVLIVTGRHKGAIEDHFDRQYELEETLARDPAKAADLDRVRAAELLAQIHYVRQGDPRGLGDAVGRARRHVGDEAFAVLLADDFVDPADPLLPTMLRVHAARGGCVLALAEVAPDDVRLYGCAAVAATDDEGVVRVTGLVEKPSPEEAPSNLVLIGRYVLDPAIFAALEHTPPGRGGEVQLTDAVARLVDAEEAGGPVWGVVYRGRRYDVGDRAGYLRAVVQLACERDDVGPEFRQWLRGFVAEQSVAGG